MWLVLKNARSKLQGGPPRLPFIRVHLVLWTLQVAPGLLTIFFFELRAFLKPSRAIGKCPLDQNQTPSYPSIEGKREERLLKTKAFRNTAKVLECGADYKK